MPVVGITGGKLTHVDGVPVDQPAHVVPPPPRLPGLGDLVATFAQPIAAVIDRITESMLSAEHKTALRGCSACARRQNKLNLLCPDIRTCPFLGKLVEMLPASARGALLDAAQKRIKAG